MSRRMGKTVFAAMLFLCLAAGISGCCRRTEAAAYTDFRELEDKRIGVATGTVQALQAEERFPDAQLLYFSSDIDMLNALRARKNGTAPESWA